MGLYSRGGVLIVAAVATALAAVAFLMAMPEKRPTDGAEPIQVVRGGERVPSRPQPASPLPLRARAAEVDPMTTVLASAAPAVRELHASLAGQPHDEATKRTEQRLTSALPAGLQSAALGEVLQVTCSADLCELLGSVADTPANVESDLTNMRWRDTLPRLGYSLGPTAVAVWGEDTVFLQYIIRLR
jgi:type IV secretory pathway VirB10-like protein